MNNPEFVDIDGSLPHFLGIANLHACFWFEIVENMFEDALLGTSIMKWGKDRIFPN